MTVCMRFTIFSVIIINIYRMKIESKIEPIGIWVCERADSREFVKFPQWRQLLVIRVHRVVKVSALEPGKCFNYKTNSVDKSNLDWQTKGISLLF